MSMRAGIAMPYVFASIARFSSALAAGPCSWMICTGCFPRCVTPAFAPGRPSRMVSWGTRMKGSWPFIASIA